MGGLNNTLHAMKGQQGEGMCGVNFLRDDHGQQGGGGGGDRGSFLRAHGAGSDPGVCVRTRARACVFVEFEPRYFLRCGGAMEDTLPRACMEPDQTIVCVRARVRALACVFVCVWLVLIRSDDPGKSTLLFSNQTRPACAGFFLV